MHLGIFGGSFDPVHEGHLALAHACQQQQALDEVWFTPAAIQPLKYEGPRASAADRVEMLRLATEEEPSWRVCTVEIERGGVSYTVDTIHRLHDELPDARLFFLIGSDAVRDVPRWREPQEIFRIATPLVVCRSGQPRPDMTAVARLCASDTQPRLVEMQPVDASSSEIRQRLAHRQPISHLVPAAVADYITLKSIYG